MTIALTTPAVATGRVEADTGAPPAFSAAQVRVSAVAADAAPVAFGGGGAGTVADDYSFDVRGMSGRRTCACHAPAGWYLKRILHDGRDVTDAPLGFEPGSQLSGLRVVLTQSAAVGVGQRARRSRRRGARRHVVVFPDDETLWRSQSRFIRTARPDTSGRFEITACPAPRATASSRCRALEDGQASDPEFLASVRDRAERLSVNEGEAKTMDLRLRP